MERKQKSNQVTIQNMTFIPMAQNRKLKVGANTTTNNGHDYWSTILFDGVNYSDEDDQMSFQFEAADGSDYFIERVPRNVNVKVHCSCLDFYYRFAVWDNKFMALDGSPPPPYIRKTETRPPVNPMQSPGLCKHLMAIIENLQSQGMFR